MTVKALITQLLEMPLNAEVVTVTKNESAEYFYSKPDVVVNYEDDYVGILNSRCPAEAAEYFKEGKP